MRRVFWVALGATAGVLVVRRISRAAAAYTPAGMASGLAGLGEGLRELADAVRDGMATREQELRIALGIDTGTLDPELARTLIEDPSAPHPRR